MCFVSTTLRSSQREIPLNDYSLVTRITGVFQPITELCFASTLPRPSQRGMSLDASVGDSCLTPPAGAGRLARLAVLLDRALPRPPGRSRIIPIIYL